MCLRYMVIGVNMPSRYLILMNKESPNDNTIASKILVKIPTDFLSFFMQYFCLN